MASNNGMAMVHKEAKQSTAKKMILESRKMAYFKNLLDPPMR